jgi:hypothetical protein
MSQQRRLYRLWKPLELKIAQLAQEQDTTPAKMLNIILTEALKDVRLAASQPESEEDDEDDGEVSESLPDIASHDAF